MWCEHEESLYHFDAAGVRGHCQVQILYSSMQFSGESTGSSRREIQVQMIHLQTLNRSA